MSPESERIIHTLSETPMKSTRTATPRQTSARASVPAAPRRKLKDLAPDGKEHGPRVLPEREYAKTEGIHAEIGALLALQKIIRTEDVMRELNLTRSNANFHLEKMAAKGLLCLGFEPHRGQNRYIAARAFEVIGAMVEAAPPQRGESAPRRGAAYPAKS
jgi:hypothetical protein